MYPNSFQTFVPLFLFERSSKRKSEHKKFWKRMGGAGGKERTFFKRFFLTPARRIAEQGNAMQSPEQVQSFGDCQAQGLCEAGFSALTHAEPGWRKKSPVTWLIFLFRRVPPPPFKGSPPLKIPARGVCPLTRRLIAFGYLRSLTEARERSDSRPHGSGTMPPARLGSAQRQPAERRLRGIAAAVRLAPHDSP